MPLAADRGAVVLLGTWQGQGCLSLGDPRAPWGSPSPPARKWPSQESGTPQWVRGTNSPLLHRESESRRKGVILFLLNSLCLVFGDECFQSWEKYYLRSRWKAFLCIWEIRASVSASWHCHTNTHAFINTLWWFLVWSVPQSDVPHGQKPGSAQPRVIISLKQEDEAKQGRPVFMITLLP